MSDYKGNLVRLCFNEFFISDNPSCCFCDIIDRCILFLFPPVQFPVRKLFRFAQYLLDYPEGHVEADLLVGHFVVLCGSRSSKVIFSILSIRVRILICVHWNFSRFTIRILQTMMAPSDVTRALISMKRRGRGEGFLVSWSRSTSASSIYR